MSISVRVSVSGEGSFSVRGSVRVRVCGAGFGVWGLNFGVWSLRSGIWGLGFGVRG